MQGNRMNRFPPLPPGEGPRVREINSRFCRFEPSPQPLSQRERGFNTGQNQLSCRFEPSYQPFSQRGRGFNTGQNQLSCRFEPSSQPFSQRERGFNTGQNQLLPARGGRYASWLIVLALALPSSYAREETPKLPPHHHLVEIKIPETMEVNPLLPLKTGRKLECPVCHGIEDIDEKDFDKVDKKDPRFLRGGPYPDLQAFCFNCHDEDKHQRPNIHAMLDERGEIIEDHCTYCHQEKPDRDKAQSLEEIKLRAPVDTLCWGCHLKTPHLNAAEHQVEPSDKVKEQRKRFLETHPEVILPLTEDGKVTCITCHTPHPPGVLDKKLPAAHQTTSGQVDEGPVYEDSPWAAPIAADKRERLETLARKYGHPFPFRYRQIKKEALLRLPAKDGQLCRACHTFDE